ncbi:MAG: DUF3575 domain-containing protein [Tannerellaceae bacterium]|nr:DUF3575 domain-containing protein [Tannerellaceae bacterium]
MNPERVFYILVCMIITIHCFSQEVTIGTNLLYWGTTSPNLSVETALSKKTTLELTGAYNPFNLGEHKKFKHWKIQPELRLWNCEKFVGSFFGIHGFYSEFNVGGINFPGKILSGLKENRYQGYTAGGGISYGYQWYLSPHWNLEAMIGVGYAYIHYDKYECKNCGRHLKTSHKHYVGPTRVGVSLIYLLPSKK